jgi:hypothetical protein
MRIRVLVIVAAVAMAFVMTARGQVIDTSFDAHVDTSTVLNHSLDKILVTPDGKMIASGGFNRYNGRNTGGSFASMLMARSTILSRTILFRAESLARMNRSFCPMERFSS